MSKTRPESTGVARRQSNPSQATFVEPLEQRRLYAATPSVAYRLGTHEAIAGDRISVKGPELDGATLNRVAFSANHVTIDVPVISSNAKRFIVAVPPVLDPATLQLGDGQYKLHLILADGTYERVRGKLSVTAAPKPKGKLGKATLTYLNESYANMADARKAAVSLAASPAAKRVVKRKYNTFLAGIQDQIDTVTRIAAHGGEMQVTNPSADYTPVLNRTVLKQTDKLLGRMLANGDTTVASTTTTKSLSAKLAEKKPEKSYGVVLDAFKVASTDLSYMLGAANAVALYSGNVPLAVATGEIAATAYVALTICPFVASMAVKAATAFIEAPDGGGFAAVRETDFSAEMNFVSENTLAYAADVFLGGLSKGLGGEPLKMAYAAIDPCLDVYGSGTDGIGRTAAEALFADDAVTAQPAAGSSAFDFQPYAEPTTVPEFTPFNDPAPDDNGGDNGGGDNGGGDNGGGDNGGGDNGGGDNGGGDNGGGTDTDKKAGYLSLTAFLPRPADLDDSEWNEIAAGYNQSTDNITVTGTSTGVNYVIDRLPTSDFDADAATYVSGFPSPWQITSGPSYSAS